MVNKLLIIGPAWVGDMVMAQCLFKLLKQRNPNVTIDVLAPAWSLPLLERMPEVANAIVMPIQHGQLKLFARYKLAKSLRANRYDQAIVLPNSFKSALIPWWANIPIITGWRREMRHWIMNDARKLNKERYPLMIERFMALGLPEGEALPMGYPLPDLSVAKNTNYKTAKILALCPGAEFGAAKRWPEEYYAEVAKEKLAQGWKVWILGSVKDQPTAKKINALTQDRCEDFAGKTKLAEAVDLLAQATAVVSNDSGLMHIAAALRKPLIAVYGPTSATFTPPLHAEARVLSLKLNCQPCFKRECPLNHHRCMRELEPKQILQALKEQVK